MGLSSSAPIPVAIQSASSFTKGRQIAKSPRTGVEKSPAPEALVDE